MELASAKTEKLSSEVFEVRDLTQIKSALLELLYVPDERLKPKIVSEIVNYFKAKFSNPENKVKFFVARQNERTSGFVSCLIDDEYKSYGMSCPTFGWLRAKNFLSCKKLMNECEKFVRENKMRKIRGPINYPKYIGGIGFQTEGFEAPMMSGIAFGDPESRVLEYLEELGYKKESKYSCLDTFLKRWAKGRDLDEEIVVRFLPLDEIKDLIDQIMDLASQSLYAVLADAPGGRTRFDEFMNAYAQTIEFLKVSSEEIPQEYADISGFQETWESCDLKRIVPMAAFAFDRNTDELIGTSMCQPNLYQLWNGEPLTHMNVDTAMVKKEYTGRGVFSALHNVGKFLSSTFGFNYYEGTTIWANNDRAIKTIFPHGVPVRTHYVVQKRILRKK